MKIRAIVGMTKDKVIGINNTIPWKYKQDMVRFKKLTTNHIVLMGRKTFDSIGKSLPNRQNYVLTHQALPLSEDNVKNFDLKAMSGKMGEFIKHCSITYTGKDLWIIGGGQIYEKALPYCDEVDVTWIPENIATENAVLFPKLNENLWEAQEITINTEDSRLTHQLFFNKNPIRLG